MSEEIEWEQVDMSKHADGNLGIGSAKIEPSITFHSGGPTKEVMRIDRHGIKVNPEFTVDEATQHVLNALSAHIQHTINHAVAQEREACAQVCDEIHPGLSTKRAAEIIRARGNT